MLPMFGCDMASPLQERLRVTREPTVSGMATQSLLRSVVRSALSIHGRLCLHASRSTVSGKPDSCLPVSDTRTAMPERRPAP
jgi:hypothetical protein